MGFVRSGLNRELNERNQHINPIEGGGADLPPLSRICVYAPVYTYTRSNFFLTIPHFE